MYLLFLLSSCACRKNKKSSNRSTVKVTKEDISPPLNFQHFYHGQFHKEDGMFSGLPQQWNSLVALAKENQCEDTDSSRSVIIEGASRGEGTMQGLYGIGHSVCVPVGTDAVLFLLRLE